MDKETDANSDDNGEYLRDELYARIRNEPELFDWLQQASIDGLFYWDLENMANEWMSPGTFFRETATTTSTSTDKNEEQRW